MRMTITEIYCHNHQNRMARSRVIDDEAQTIVSARYGYDPLGRRSVVHGSLRTARWRGLFFV